MIVLIQFIRKYLVNRNIRSERIISQKFHFILCWCFIHQLRHLQFLVFVICFFYVSIFSIAYPVRGQNQYSSQSGDDMSEMIRQITEGLDPGDFENEAAFEEYILDLQETYPIDLNRATRNEFLQIPVISSEIVTAIINYREEQAYTNVDELLSVKGIDSSVVRQIRPWFTVEPKRQHRPGNSRILSVQQLARVQYALPVPEGYQNIDGKLPQFAGSPLRIYHKHSIKGSWYSGNVTQVKLPGESLSHPMGFDFTSAHASIENVGPLRRLVAGDYSIRMGQGLVIWSAPSFGKGGSSHRAPYRRGPGVSPYSSSGQIRFLRGLASEIAFPVPWLHQYNKSILIMTAFYSNRHKSAVIVQGDTIRPPSSNPYHRTLSELARRNNVTEKIYGGNLTYENSAGRIGFTFYEYKTDKIVLPTKNSSILQGQPNMAFGSDFIVNIRKLNFFGEYALGPWPTSVSVETSVKSIFDESEKTSLAFVPDNRFAWITGITGGFMETFDWVFSIRNYQSDYWSELGNGFGEGSGVPANQSGWYFGYRIRPPGNFETSGYIDRFHFPDPRRGFTRPSEGWETAIQIKYYYKPGIDFKVKVRYKKRSAEIEELDTYLRKYFITGNESRLSGRLQASWQYEGSLLFRSQLDVINAGLQPGIMHNGLALSQVFRWQITSALHVDLHLSVFETDSYTSRIYLYEYGLTYAMSSSMVYGAGQKSYIVIRYHPADWFLLEAKTGRIRYFDRPVIGSGPDLTTGPSRLNFGLQMRLMY